MHPSIVRTLLNREYEGKLYDQHDRPKYWGFSCWAARNFFLRSSKR
jgi:hypothetical protein